MRSLPPDVLTSPAWQHRFDELARRHHVPGAQVGLVVLGPGEEVDLRVMSTGVTSLSTRVEVTKETLFQHGSITKVWVATLIMQLVDEGLLDLDAQVVDVLDDFTLADPDDANRITVRQLLDHTSGIDGDVFTDTGDGDDCVTRYVQELRTAASTTPPGGHLSYCNAGFVVAGRIIEVLRGCPFDEALAEYLVRPLGLQHTITKAKDAPLFRTAVGHLQVAGGDAVEPTTTWMLPRSMGPAGLITSTVTDLLTFAAAHLRDGVGLNGTRVLSSASARMMREVQVDLTPDSTVLRGWGIGWSLPDWVGATAVSHGGSTIGQTSDLHVFPEQQLALAVLTNSSTGPALIKDLLDLLGGELGLTPPSPRYAPDAGQVDLAPLVGRYESTASRWDISRAEDGTFRVAVADLLALYDEPDPEPRVIHPSGPGRFITTENGSDLEVTHVRSGGREYLWAVRLLERVEP